MDNQSISFKNLEDYNQRLTAYVKMYFFRLKEAEEAAMPSTEKLPCDESFYYSADMLDTVFDEKIKSSEQEGFFLPFHTMCKNFNTNYFEFFSLLLAFCCEIDEEVLNMAKSCSGKINFLYPDISLSVRLIRTRYQISYNSSVINSSINKLFKYFFEPPENGISINSHMKLKTDILEFFVSGKFRYQRDIFQPSENIFNCIDNLPEIPKGVLSSNNNLLVAITGKQGSGRRTCARIFSKHAGAPVFFINIAKIMSGKNDLTETIRSLSFWSRATGSIPLIYDIETALSFSKFKNHITDIMDELFIINKAVFVTLTKNSDIKYLENLRNTYILKFNIPNPVYSEKEAVWEKYLKKYNMPADLSKSMSSKFDITPRQINSSLAEYTTLYGGNEIDEKKLNRCCYNHINSELDKYADFIPPSFDWEQLILSDKLKETLINGCSHILNALKVYDVWGFGKRLAYGKGVSMLFTGAPGTGKTMAAQVISAKLGIDLYKVDSSRLVSKYIGETEKNFDAVFNAAAKSSVILFFDEMDALFGKRSEVSEANDKYANATTSYLLQKTEEYNGVILMATNYMSNVDEAFMRRINYVIHFPVPSADTRKKIWQSMLPTAPDISRGIDFDYIAENFEITGGVIKNIVISAAFLAAAESRPISMKHIIKALYYDRGKQGKTIIKSEFGKYSFYIDNL